MQIAPTALLLKLSIFFQIPIALELVCNWFHSSHPYCLNTWRPKRHKGYKVVIPHLWPGSEHNLDAMIPIGLTITFNLDATFLAAVQVWLIVVASLHCLLTRIEDVNSFTRINRNLVDVYLYKLCNYIIFSS